MGSPIRVSCAALCRFKVGAGYLLLLNRNRREKGLYELAPVGGAIEFYDERIVGQFEMQLETAGIAELRFVSDQSHIEDFRQWFYQREGREIDPFREIYEELVVEAGILAALHREDLAMRYLHTVEDAKPTQRKGVTGMFTQYFLEIFEVTVNTPDVTQQLLAADESSGMVIVDETTARQARCLPLHIDGAIHQAALVTDRLFS